jgi:quercetin dioxygenase-like cupin family protein
MSTVAAEALLAPVVVPPGGGQCIRAFGNALLLKLTGEQTGNAVSLALAEAAPHHGPPLHVHDREDEIFIILEGQYRVFSEGEWSDAGPGSVVFLPRGVAHTFRVESDEPGRHWVITTSGDFGHYFLDCAEVFAVPGPPDAARLGAIGATHGMRIVGPPAR